MSISPREGHSSPSNALSVAVEAEEHHRQRNKERKDGAPQLAMVEAVAEEPPSAASSSSGANESPRSRSSSIFEGDGRASRTGPSVSKSPSHLLLVKDVRGSGGGPGTNRSSPAKNAEEVHHAQKNATADDFARRKKSADGTAVPPPPPPPPPPPEDNGDVLIKPPTPIADAELQGIRARSQLSIASMDQDAGEMRAIYDSIPEPEILHVPSTNPSSSSALSSPRLAPADSPPSLRVAPPPAPPRAFSAFSVVSEAQLPAGGGASNHLSSSSLKKLVPKAPSWMLPSADGSPALVPVNTTVLMHQHRPASSLPDLARSAGVDESASNVGTTTQNNDASVLLPDRSEVVSRDDRPMKTIREESKGEAGAASPRTSKHEESIGAAGERAGAVPERVSLGGSGKKTRVFTVDRKSLSEASPSARKSVGDKSSSKNQDTLRVVQRKSVPAPAVDATTTAKKEDDGAKKARAAANEDTTTYIDAAERQKSLVVTTERTGRPEREHHPPRSGTGRHRREKEQKRQGTLDRRKEPRGRYVDSRSDRGAKRSPGRGTRYHSRSRRGDEPSRSENAGAFKPIPRNTQAGTKEGLQGSSGVILGSESNTSSSASASRAVVPVFSLAVPPLPREKSPENRARVVEAEKKPADLHPSSSKLLQVPTASASHGHRPTGGAKRQKISMPVVEDKDKPKTSGATSGEPLHNSSTAPAAGSKSVPEKTSAAKTANVEVARIPAVVSTFVPSAVPKSASIKVTPPAVSTSITAAPAAATGVGISAPVLNVLPVAPVTQKPRSQSDMMEVSSDGGSICIDGDLSSEAPSDMSNRHRPVAEDEAGRGPTSAQGVLDKGTEGSSSSSSSSSSGDKDKERRLQSVASVPEKLSHKRRRDHDDDSEHDKDGAGGDGRGPRPSRGDADGAGKNPQSRPSQAGQARSKNDEERVAMIRQALQEKRAALAEKRAQEAAAGEKQEPGRLRSKIQQAFQRPEVQAFISRANTTPALPATQTLPVDKDQNNATFASSASSGLRMGLQRLYEKPTALQEGQVGRGLSQPHAEVDVVTRVQPEQQVPERGRPSATAAEAGSGARLSTASKSENSTKEKQQLRMGAPVRPPLVLPFLTKRKDSDEEANAAAKRSHNDLRKLAAQAQARHDEVLDIMKPVPSSPKKMEKNRLCVSQEAAPEVVQNCAAGDKSYPPKDDSVDPVEDAGEEQFIINDTIEESSVAGPPMLPEESVAVPVAPLSIPEPKDSVGNVPADAVVFPQAAVAAVTTAGPSAPAAAPRDNGEPSASNAEAVADPIPSPPTSSSGSPIEIPSSPSSARCTLGGLGISWKHSDTALPALRQSVDEGFSALASLYGKESGLELHEFYVSLLQNRSWDLHSVDQENQQATAEASSSSSSSLLFKPKNKVNVGDAARLLLQMVPCMRALKAPATRIGGMWMDGPCLVSSAFPARVLRSQGFTKDFRQWVGWVFTPAIGLRSWEFSGVLPPPIPTSASPGGNALECIVFEGLPGDLTMADLRDLCVMINRDVLQMVSTHLDDLAEVSSPAKTGVKSSAAGGIPALRLGDGSKKNDKEPADTSSAAQVSGGSTSSKGVQKNASNIFVVASSTPPGSAAPSQRGGRQVLLGEAEHSAALQTGAASSSSSVPQQSKMHTASRQQETLEAASEGDEPRGKRTKSEELGYLPGPFDLEKNKNPQPRVRRRSARESRGSNSSFQTVQSEAPSFHSLSRLPTERR
ncbi:unnamed protein product [Amoebophrya sp. A120]|nr:unnamed protein product [Amoebophrya sp. A120]|eukprot:GSA120T00005166001.1